MQKNKKTVLTFMTPLLAVMFVFGLSVVASAQVSLDLPTEFAGFGSQDLKSTIENIVRIVLGFLGVVFLVLVLYAGFVWMTSGGSEDKINRAKKILVSAVIGLLITLSAYSIARFIINSIEQASTAGDTSGSSGGPTGFGFALGAGVLESHFPARNATDVPRNVNIFLTFKEEINPDTVCLGGGGGLVDTSAIIIEDVTDANDVPIPNGNDIEPPGLGNNILDQVTCTTNDNLTFKFDPAINIGLQSGDVVYEVRLTAGIEKLADGNPALPFGYSWKFTVSTFADETPPTITSVYPPIGAFVPRNTIVQINFSEAVDPTTASGIFDTGAGLVFTNITLDDASTSLEGSYISGNQFKTTEFFTNEICGTNSCGGDVYCLPSIVNIIGTVTDNISDMAGNFLDGDNDGIALGNYIWSFDTTDDIDLDPPTMEERVPIDTSVDANLTNPVEATFSELISASSVLTTSYGFDFTDPVACDGDTVNYWTSVEHIDIDGDAVFDKTTIKLHHDKFSALDIYCPVANSDITDLNQNCFYPADCTGAPGIDC